VEDRQDRRDPRGLRAGRFALPTPLAPKQTAVWRLEAWAILAEDTRLKVELTSAHIKRLVEEIETTTLYE
jgi:hypothetical protein